MPYAQSNTSPIQRFRREFLPSPERYYAGERVKLLGRGTWRSARCPFHDDHDPSCRVNVLSGGFRCFVCDARGGDIIAFHQLRYGMGFVAACRSLGAWTDPR